MSVPASGPMTARETLDREFLELRAQLLNLAASFDRIDRGDGSVADDPRLERLREAVSIVGSSSPDRAARLQQLFSRQFHDNWKEEFKL